MATSDDECDLDTLSALLEQEASNSCTVDEHSIEPDSSVQTKIGPADIDIGDDEIAAFLTESLDSENEADYFQDKEEMTRVNGVEDNLSSKTDGSSRHKNLFSSDREEKTDLADSQKDPVHVKKLQDELALMQQRMLEIQQLLSSQTVNTSESVMSVSSPSDAQKRQQMSKSNITDGGRCEIIGKMEPASVLSSDSFSSLLSSALSTPKSLNGNRCTSSSSRQLPTSTVSSLSQDNSHQKRPHENGYANHILKKDRTLSNRPDSSSVKICRDNSSSPKLDRSNSRENGKRKLHNNASDVDSKYRRRKEMHKTDSIANSKSSVRKESDAEVKNGSVVRQSCSQVGKKKESSLSDGRSRQPSFLSNSPGNSVTDKKQEEADNLKVALFGDEDSDSDWENMNEPDETAQLSSAGQEMKKLITQGVKQRQAHRPSYSPPSFSSTSTSWKSKPVGKNFIQKTDSALNQTGTLSPSSSVRKEVEDKDLMTEKFSGLRIKNPKISSTMIGAKMEGRKMIPVSRLHLKVKSPDLQSDWVTIGVIVQKSDARKSQTGKTFSIWKMSDLQDTDTTVSFFLFGQVYKQLWKMDVGNVIGLLNPSIMESVEKSSGDVAFTVNNPNQVMEIGQSKDLGWCIGKTKRGTTCTKFINKKFGDFCTYHVQAAYRHQAAKRGELQGSFPGTTPKSSLKDKLLQNNTFFYGGETFTSSKGRGQSKRDKVTLTKLQSQLTQQDLRKVNTLTIQDLMPADKASVKSKVASQHEQPFLSMLSVPSVGSMNLVKHIAKADGHVPRNGMNTCFQSIHAGDLIKLHQQQLIKRLPNKKQAHGSTNHKTGNKQFQTSSESQGRADYGGVNKYQLPGKNENDKNDSQSSNIQNGSNKHSISFSEVEKDSLQSDKSNNSGINITDNSERRSSGTTVHRTAHPKLEATTRECPSQLAEDTEGSPVNATGVPVIGKGFYPGSKIDLFRGSTIVFSKHRTTPADLAKRKAIEKIHTIGGLEKVDPNAVRKSIQNPDTVLKHVLENIENENKNINLNAAGAEPARKKARLLGDVDPDSEEVKQLLKARSAHKGALAEAEAEREDQYFENLEKKEMMEEKMKSVTSMEVTVYTCAQCKYTAMSMADRCKQEQHTVKKHKGRRSFFACKKCKQRTVSLHRYPSSPCKKCGELSFEKTSMHRERTGPKLDSEILCLRGDESKFINAMDQKVFMATFEDS